MNASPKVCIIGLKCYDAIVGSQAPRYIGGIETQLAVLARGLQEQGTDVSLITYDHGQLHSEVIDGVKLYKAYLPEGGRTPLRWIARTKNLLTTMRQAGADIYLQMGAGLETGLTAFGCTFGRLSNARFVFCLAHDSNYGARLRSGFLGWEGHVYRRALRRANLIVVQTIRQQQGLLDAVGLRSVVIPMPAPPPQVPLGSIPPCDRPPRIVWVGRFAPEKRLEWLIELARRLPDVAFDVAGSANMASSYSDRLLHDAQQVPNITLHGRLGPLGVAALYRGARLLCNTSLSEGFPTTFLEAWSHGLPVVSTFDADNRLAHYGVGLVATDLDGLAAGLRRLLCDRPTYVRYSEAALRVYSELFAVVPISRRFRSAFEQLVAE